MGLTGDLRWPPLTCIPAGQRRFLRLIEAEDVGFEPTKSFPLPVFKTARRICLTCANTYLEKVFVAPWSPRARRPPNGQLGRPANADVLMLPDLKDCQQ